MKKNKTKCLIALSSLSFALVTASCSFANKLFSGKQEHEHTFEFQAEEAATCAKKGHEAYNLCTECEKLFDLDGNEISEPKEIELDPNEHEHAKSLVIDSGYKASYSIGDTFDLANSNFRWKCDMCEGVALVATAKNTLTVKYPTEGATCFTAQDTAHDSVEVIISSTTYSTKAVVSVSKKDNAILGFDNMEVHCGTTMSYFDDLSVSSRSGETVQFSFKEPGESEFKAKEEYPSDYVFTNVNKGETPTVIQVKAFVPGNDEYSQASSTKNLTITHNEMVWDTTREDYDYVGCLCSPEDVIKFNKEVEGTQELIISNGNGTLNLNGSSYDSTTCTVKAIALDTEEGTINLGNNLSSIPLTELAEKDVFGEQTIKVTVESPKNDLIPACEHVLNVKVDIVTALISSKAEWEASVMPTEAGQVIKGYFKVTEDLTLDKYPNWISNWDKAFFSGIIDGQNHKITVGQGNFGQFYVLDKATLKNMTIHNPWWRRVTAGYAMFAQKSLDSTFENLTFDVPTIGSGEKDAYVVGSNYGYLFGNGGAQRNAFKNCSWDFGNYELPCLLSYSTNSTKSNTFENCTLTCKDYQEIYHSNEGAVVEAEGLTITTNASIDLTIPAQELDSKASSCSITLPEEYNSLTVVDAYFVVDGVNTSVGTDLSNIVLPEALKNNTALHGSSTLYVKVNNGTKDITLSVPVVILTSWINDAAELLAVAHADKGAKIYGYYKLASNINISSSGWTDFASGAFSTFSGTLDGNGMTITSKSRLYGLFGALENATIKNLTILDAWSYGGCDGASPLLSQDMQSSTIENCTFRVTNQASRTLKTGDSFPISIQSYGWINSRVCQNNKFKDCTFDAGTKVPVQTLLGTHPSCVGITFENSTFSCGTYYCLYQSNYTGLVTTTAEGLTITGTCAYSA